MKVNPNTRRRRLTPDDANRILVYAPDGETLPWVVDELTRVPGVIHRAVATVAEAVIALVDEPPPRPQVLIADFDAMTAAEVLHLHTIRECGWFGAVIGIGKVGVDLRTSLHITRVVTRPLLHEALRSAVVQIGMDRATTKIPKIDP